MSRRSRRNHTPAFRAKVALAAVKGDKTLSELAAQFDVHPTQITQWKAQLLERAASVFEGGAQSTEPPVDLKALHAKIGELALVPGFDFHGLEGKPKRYSVHVNGPFCITFEWIEGDAWRVDLENYH